MTELLLGIACGLALSLFFSFGPAFFSQLRTSIEYGYRRSYPFAFGVSAGDVLCVGLMLTLLQNVNLFEVMHNVWVASIACVVLVFMGIHYFRREVATLEDCKGSRIKFKSKDGVPRRRTIFFQGFIINFVNPFIWIYWVSVIALTGELDMSAMNRLIFFAGLLGTTLGMDLLKCKLASLLQQYITATMLNISNKVCAFVMFAFAVYMLVSMIQYQVNPEVRVREQEQPNNKTEMIKKIHNLQKIDSLSELTPWGRRHNDSMTIENGDSVL